MEFLKLLNIMEKLEIAMAEFYQYLSEKFSDDAEVYHLFQKLSREEIDHRNLVRYQKSIVKKNPKDFAPIDVDEVTIRHLIEAVENVVKAKTSFGLEESIRLSYSLEMHYSEDLLRTAIRESNPKLASLVDKLSKETTEHKQRVMNFAVGRWGEEEAAKICRIK